MIGRVTNVGMFDYTASYDGKKLYLYEQSRLVAEREIKGLTGVVFDGNFVYYTLNGSNIIYAENVLGQTLNNYTLGEFEKIAVYKKLGDNEFVIETDGKKTAVYNILSSKVVLKLPYDSFHDFVYDGANGFRLSGHQRKNISFYEDDCDSEDILYSEYSIGDSGELREKCHFGICEIENGDKFVSCPDSSNIVFSLFDNYLDCYFYPYILTPSYIVSKCDQLNGFIVFAKTTGELKYLISLPEKIYDDIEMYGFNELTSVLTVFVSGELHRYKVVISDNKPIEELHNKYMTAYKADKEKFLGKNFEFDKMFYKAIDSCEICEIKD